MSDQPKNCPVCGWTPPRSQDSSNADQIAAHAVNVKHPRERESR